MAGFLSGELERRLRDSGWRGSPVHAVLWGDGSLATLDHRRVWAAERADLPRIPVVIHSPNDPIAQGITGGEALPDEDTIRWIFQWKGKPPQAEDTPHKWAWK